MRRQSLTVFADYWFCLAAIGTLGGSLYLIDYVSRDHQRSSNLWLQGLILAGVVALLVWRVMIVRRVNRAGITVEGEVTDVCWSPSRGGGTTYVSVKYTCERKEVQAHFPWWYWGWAPPKGDRLLLMIDPRKPSRCYVRKKLMATQQTKCDLCQAPSVAGCGYCGRSFCSQHGRVENTFCGIQSNWFRFSICNKCWPFQRVLRGITVVLFIGAILCLCYVGLSGR